jgi:hypothetical protein
LRILELKCIWLKHYSLSTTRKPALELELMLLFTSMTYLCGVETILRLTVLPWFSNYGKVTYDFKENYTSLVSWEHEEVNYR